MRDAARLRWIWFTGLVSFAAFMAGCMPLFPFSSTPMPSPVQATMTPTETPTPTRIWFPATETPTPRSTGPTQTPTIDLRPLDGLILLQDDFSQTDRWELIQANYGSVAYGKNELTIAIKEVRRSLYTTIFEPVPADYYLEVTINPSLCKNDDQYGVIFRTQSNSQFYRFVLQCDGVMRIDWVQGSSAAPLATLEKSGQVLPGPLQKLRVGLWLYQDEVRVFVNDIYQFSAYRLQYLDGGLGFFGRAIGGSALTVNFSDLVLRESAPLPPTPTPSVTPEPTLTKTKLNESGG